MSDILGAAGLHASLKEIREVIRLLFEQLRLKHENGDVSGKERLERVPALSKRNFGNLTGDHPGRAIAEAWRLVDFLEGAKAGQLSPLAREALRPIELDAHLARLRASDQWRDAALSLRRTLDEPAVERRVTDPAPPEEGELGDAPAAGGDLAKAGSRVSDASDTRAPRGPGRALTATLAGAALLVAILSVFVLRTRGAGFDPEVACLPLERASDADRAAHWIIAARTALPQPEPDPANPNPVMLTISDPADGPIRSIFTNSQFSFEEAPADRRATGPGGGLANGHLRIGGWGDTYLSLLKFPLPDDRPVRRAIIRLTALPDAEVQSRTTSMVLRLIHDPWDVPAGAQHRLWWRDCPRSAAFMRLPAPGDGDTHYGIDITEIYNSWARGEAANHGIMLEPEQIGSYGASAEHYAHFNTFHSTRATHPEKRPKLILTY